MEAPQAIDELLENLQEGWIVTTEPCICPEWVGGIRRNTITFAIENEVLDEISVTYKRPRSSNDYIYVVEYYIGGFGHGESYQEELNLSFLPGVVKED